MNKLFRFCNIRIFSELPWGVHHGVNTIPRSKVNQKCETFQEWEYWCEDCQADSEEPFFCCLLGLPSAEQQNKRLNKTLAKPFNWFWCGLLYFGKHFLNQRLAPIHELLIHAWITSILLILWPPILDNLTAHNDRQFSRSRFPTFHFDAHDSFHSFLKWHACVNHNAKSDKFLINSWTR